MKQSFRQRLLATRILRKFLLKFRNAVATEAYTFVRIQFRSLANERKSYWTIKYCDMRKVHLVTSVSDSANIVGYDFIVLAVRWILIREVTAMANSLLRLQDPKVFKN